MMFLKYLCCKETLSAKITTGDIKTLPQFKNPMLEIHIQVAMGSINASTDFLYLQPQLQDAHQPSGTLAVLLGNQDGATKGTTASTLPTNMSRHQVSKAENQSERPDSAQGASNFGGPEDRDPLPRRLRDVKKDRVILIEKNSSICDNVGIAFIDYMGIEKGKYKLYYMRIESEQRIMYNSRLLLVGQSSTFSINNVTSSSHDMAGMQSQRRTLKDLLEDKQPSESGTVQRHHVESFNDSSDLDSLILMNQIQGGFAGTNGGTFISNSVHSSEQTLFFNQSPVTNSKCNSGWVGNQGRSDFKSLNSSGIAGSSSGSSTVTFIVKNENDEALIVTQSRIGNPGALTSQSFTKHKRGINIQSVLEDISTSRYSNKGSKFAASNQDTSSRNSKELINSRTYEHAVTHAKTSKIVKTTPLSSKKASTKIIDDKENKRDTTATTETLLEQKTAQRYLNSSLSQPTVQNQRLPQMKKVNLNVDTDAPPHHYFYDKEIFDPENNLNIRYVTDIESISGGSGVPRFNPDTRTYFKCSIYSPSNRLYTVQEEVNSTQSDAGAGEQFSSSLLNSGLRKSRGPGKVQSVMRNSGTIVPFPDRILDEFSNGRGSNQKIVEEDENEDDTGNVSETISLPGSQNPTPHLRGCDNKMIFSQSSQTGGHTRTNSSKAQSLKGSIVIQKPALSSQFSSIVLQNNSQHQEKRKGTSTKVLKADLAPNESRKLASGGGGRNINNLKVHQSNTEHALLLADIDQFLQQMPTSFVCTGGTEFHNESATPVVSSAIRLSKHQKQLIHMTPDASAKNVHSAKKNHTLQRHSTESEKFGKQDEDTKSSFPFSPQNLNEDSSSLHSPPGNFDDSRQGYSGHAKSGSKYIKDWIGEEDASKRNRYSGAQQQKSVIEKVKPLQMKRIYSPIKASKLIQTSQQHLKTSVAQSRFTAELTKNRFK